MPVVLLTHYQVGADIIGRFNVANTHCITQPYVPTRRIELIPFGVEVQHAATAPSRAVRSCCCSESRPAKKPKAREEKDWKLNRRDHGLVCRPGRLVGRYEVPVATKIV